MIVGRGTHVIHGVVQLFFFFVGDDGMSNFGGPAGDALFAGSQNRPKSTKTLFRVTILCILFLRGSKEGVVHRAHKKNVVHLERTRTQELGALLSSGSAHCAWAPLVVVGGLRSFFFLHPLLSCTFSFFVK
jgi:hypothetical protein